MGITRIADVQGSNDCEKFTVGERAIINTGVSEYEVEVKQYMGSRCEVLQPDGDLLIINTDMLTKLR